jgi:hypothetical protein
MVAGSLPGKYTGVGWMSGSEQGREGAAESERGEGKGASM